MMATVVVDLRLQDQFSDFFVQGESQTEVGSMADTEADQSFTSAAPSASAVAPSHHPRMAEEYLRPTIVEIPPLPPLQPLEIECPAPRSMIRRRRRRRFLDSSYM